MSFEEWDWVFPRLQPYKRISLKKINKHNKVAPKYYGPYKVLYKIGSIAYKLELSSFSSEHPIFHISCLNKVIQDKIPIQAIFSKLDE